MTMIQAARQHSRIQSSMDRCDDEVLLKQVGSRGDREAFAQIYSRYEKQAFGLALHLTGNHALAEDAVQEAMLGVWQGASRYRPGNVRGWIMRIVANQAIHLRRTRKKDHSQVTHDEVEESPAPIGLPEDDVKRVELTEALMRMLESLAEGDRRLVALYYGAGLSCQEIAKEEAMPSRTVSHRLQKSLDVLRANMKEAGFAGAILLLESADFGEAVCSGYAVPPGLRGRTLDRVGQTLSQPGQQVSRRAAKAHSSMAYQAVGARKLVFANSTLSSCQQCSPPTDETGKMETSTGLRRPWR